MNQKYWIKIDFSFLEFRIICVYRNLYVSIYAITFAILVDV